MTNFGVMHNLRVDGVPVGEMLEPRFRETAAARVDSYGSIIAIVATDAPLLPIAARAPVQARGARASGRVGSYAAHGSGEIVLGFSTANRVPRTHRSG